MIKWDCMILGLGLTPLTLIPLHSGPSTAGAAADPGFRALNYEIALEVEPSARELIGEARVEIVAGKKALGGARFALNKSLEVEAVAAGGKKVPHREGEAVAEGREIVCKLSPALAPGKRLELLFRFRGKGADPGESDPDWMGILLVRPDEIRMSHQAQWYPVVPLDERALAKQAAPVKLLLTLPKGMESLGPGELKGRREMPEGREVHHWESATPVQPSILAGSYEAEILQEAPLSVRVLAFPEHRAGAKAWAKEALKALQSFEAHFGKLDRGSYGIGEMRVRNREKSYNYEADGFSVYDGVLFDGRDPDPRKIGHEAAHLWWGGKVDPTGQGERFLTESLAEFSAYLYIEKEYGAARAEAAARGWEERYRKNPGDEHGLAEAGFRSPRYAETVYAKGPMALRALRARIGADKLDKGLKLYLERNSGKAPELEDFLKALRDAGGKAVDVWAKEWLFRPGEPKRDAGPGKG